MLPAKVIIVFVVLCISSITWAEEITDANEEATAEKALEIEELPNPWSGNARLGIVINTGNTENENYTGAFDLKYEQNNWRHTIDFDTQTTRSDKKAKAERYTVNVDNQYFLRETRFIFSDFDSTFDKFNAYDRILSLVIGYGWRILNKDNLFVDIKGGPGVRMARKAATDSKPSEERTSAIGLVEAVLQWQMTENTVFKQTLRADKGSDFTKSRSISALTTSLIGSLGMQYSFTVDYYSKIPSDSKLSKRVDTRTNIAVVYSF